MTNDALVSPQGHVEYNATFSVGEANLHKQTPGRWYTPQEVADLFGRAFFLSGSSRCVEKNIKKWRYEVQE